MKTVLILTAAIFGTIALNAQLNPISWTYTAKKTGDKTYEIHVRAAIENGWHLYSQTQPEDAIAEPTTISFTNNPLLTLDGKIREVGKMEKFHDEKLGISANQYAGELDFVQVVKLKTNAKTSLNGSVRFQTCDDKKCLPPKTVTFSVQVK